MGTKKTKSTAGPTVVGRVPNKPVTPNANGNRAERRAAKKKNK